MADPLAEIEDLKKKLSQNPESLIFVPLADAYRRAGKFDEAVDVCKKGLEKVENGSGQRLRGSDLTGRTGCCLQCATSGAGQGRNPASGWHAPARPEWWLTATLDANRCSLLFQGALPVSWPLARMVFMPLRFRIPTRSGRFAVVRRAGVTRSNSRPTWLEQFSRKGDCQACIFSREARCMPKGKVMRV